MLGKIWHLQYLTPHLLPLMCLFRFVMPTNKVFFFFAGSNIFSSHSLAMRFLPPFHCCRHLQRVSFLDKKKSFSVLWGCLNWETRLYFFILTKVDRISSKLSFSLSFSLSALFIFPFLISILLICRTIAKALVILVQTSDIAVT